MIPPRPSLLPLRDDPTGRLLGADLPPGRLLDETFEGPWREPLVWRSDVPALPGHWARLRAETRHTGLYPLLLGGTHTYARGVREPEPWQPDLGPDLVTDPDAFDAEQLMREWWQKYATPDADADGGGGGGEGEGEGEGEDSEADERAEMLAPHDRTWPGFAPAGTLQADPEHRAAEAADILLRNKNLLLPRLGLAPAGRSSDVLTAIGWTGPLNYDNDPAPFTAVLRSWEDRFGTRLVALTHDVLYLSVAAPPRTLDHALAVAAEHFAFCPDSIWQGSDTIHTHAEESILDQPLWAFWWD
ncbi:DUF4253 domain-containing protein [Peterkaempfera sp. SMS 1(5)a]|uniref:DUF4253 domain-containing protein n=1 Tax=Peterkaempfera podocarpi TaxID=3232308 RepID=UPI00366B61CA